MLGLANHTTWTAIAVVALLTGLAPAQAEPVRIVAFGTSATYGRYLPRGQDYPAKLEAALRAKGHDVRVTNAGKNGDFAVDALGRVDAAAPRGTQLVIMEFGVNEVKLKQQDPASIRAQVGALVDRVRARGAEVLLADYMQLDLASVARARGAQPFKWADPRLRDAKYQIPNDPLHHLNGAGYDILVQNMLPAVEAAIGRLKR
ncbi:MAG: GDSL-type esterase/lipase family protein [Xanthobacteraceae bacterium]